VQGIRFKVILVFVNSDCLKVGGFGSGLFQKRTTVYLSAALRRTSYPAQDPPLIRGCSLLYMLFGFSLVQRGLF
jgi:hypothetical protein